MSYQLFITTHLTHHWFFTFFCPQIFHLILAKQPRNDILKYDLKCLFFFPLHYHSETIDISYLDWSHSFLTVIPTFTLHAPCFRLSLHNIQSQLFKLPLILKSWQLHHIALRIKSKPLNIPYRNFVWSSQ